MCVYIYMYVYIYICVYICIYIYMCYVYIYIYNLKGPPNGWYRPDWLRFLVPWQLGPRTLDVRGSDYGAPGNRCRQSKKGLCGCTLSEIALVYLVFGWKWMGKWWLTHINTMKFGGVACGKVFQTNPPCFVCFSLAPTWTLPWGMPRMWVEPDGYNLLSPMHVLVCGLMWFERTYGLAKWIMMNHDEPWWTMMNPITNHDSKSNRFREFESSSKLHDSWTVPRLFPHLLFLHLLHFLLSSAFRVCGDLYRIFWPKCGSCEVLVQRLHWEIWTKVI